MANVADLNIFTGTMPSIGNDMKYVVYKSGEYPAETASQTFSAPHVARTVSFPGLQITNYIWKLLEVSGATVISERGSFNVVPDSDSPIKYKAPVEIEADVTVGFIAGINTFTFDGTSGTEDWRGYEIYTERVGQGTMRKGVQYSWNSGTGVFLLLQAGDAFQPNELFNIEFGIISGVSSSGIPPQNLFTSVRVVTGNTVLTAADVGKKIIIKGLSNYFEITLPDINTVSSAIPIYFEAGIGSHKCVRIKTFTGQTIDWMKGVRDNIKIGVCETLVLYREPATTVWRTHDYKGNFLTVGRIISSDAEPADEYNCIEMNGDSLSVNDYARLYEDFVLQLPPAQVCNFSDWGVANNKYKFSFSSAGLFKVPDRRNMYERNSDGTNLPGLFMDDVIKSHTITGSFRQGKSDDNESGVSGEYLRKSTASGGTNYGNITADMAYFGGTETRPKTVISRRYCLV
jgi:hypothetical protein